jgi:hypothetical protein
MCLLSMYALVLTPIFFAQSIFRFVYLAFLCTQFIIKAEVTRQSNQVDLISNSSKKD